MGAKRVSLVQDVKSLVSEEKQKYIFWKLGIITDDWEVLSKRYLRGKTQEYCDTEYMRDENVLKAMKLVMKIQHQSKMIELYNIYFERAKEDTNSFKAFVDFSKNFFDEKDDSELIKLLNGVDLEGDEDD